MSYIELHVGKIKKVDLKGKTVEEWCKEKCNELGYRLGKYDESYTRLLSSIEHGKYCSVDNDLFEVLSDKKFDDPYITHLSENKDGTYDFVLGFYNGGTCFSEMIEDAITEFKKNEGNN